MPDEGFKLLGPRRQSYRDWFYVGGHRTFAR
jgi:hypothetical protein